MALKDCIDEIRKAAGRDLSDKDVAALVKNLQKRASAKRAGDKLLSERDALDQAASDMASDEDLAAKIERRNRAINLATKQARKDERATMGEHGFSPYQQFSAELVGSNKFAPGAKASVDANGKAYGQGYIGGLANDLQKEGVLEFLTRRKGLFGDQEGVIDGDIADALYSVDKSGKVQSGTATPEVKKAAETIWKWQEAARLGLNRVGAWIKQTPGYIVQQSHDPVAMLKAGFEKWRDAIAPRLKPETYDGADPETFLQSAYDAITSGVHLTPRDDLTPDSGFRGPGNLASRYSHERVFQFKSGRDWNDYNTQFGRRSLAEALIYGLSRAGRDTALMERFGTNPEAAFRDDVDAAVRENRTNTRWKNELQGRTGHWAESLEAQWANLTGEANIVNNANVAAFFAGIRNLQSATKLGSAVFSHLTLLPTAISELRWQGLPIGQAFSSFAREFTRGLGDEDRQSAARSMGVGMEGFTQGLYERFSSQDGRPGAFSGLVRSMMKLNGMRFAIDNGQSAAGRVMAEWVGRNSGKTWANIDGDLRQAMQRYGIDEDRWNIVRQAAQALPDGRSYLTPDLVQQLPDSAFSRLGAKTANQAADARAKTANALRSYYLDRIDTAIPQPGARERAILNQGLAADTPTGIALRLIGQFKQYPVSLLTRVVGRELDGGGLQALLKGQGDIVGLSGLVAQMTVAGFLAMEAKQIVANKTPRNPVGRNWPNVWAAAAMQSGALGLYGDFLFGEYNRFGQSPLETAAGPTIGTASDAWKLLSGAIHTKTDRFGNMRPQTSLGDVVRFAGSNTPYVNLFYTRAAFDYLVLWHLQEMASPGYLRRSERNLQNQTGQSYIIPPSSVVPYGGGYQ